MPHHTLFRPEGTPLRAKVSRTVSVGDALLRITGESNPAPSGQRLLGHELSHAAQQREGVSVRGWNALQKKEIVGQEPAQWLPEVGDEVLVAFEHGDVHHGALQFNPEHLSRRAGGASVQVDLGSVAGKRVRVRVVKAGSRALGVELVTANDGRLRTGRRSLRIR